MRQQPAPNQRQFEFSLRRKAFRRFWPGVPAQVKFLLLVLEDFAGLDRDTCWPSYATLAAAMNCSEKTVGRLIAEAQRLDLLLVLKRRDRQAKAKTYKIRRAEYHARSGLLAERLDPLPDDNLTGQSVRSTSSTDRTRCPVHSQLSPDNLSGQLTSDRTKSTFSPDKSGNRDLLLEEERRTSPLTPTEWREVEKALREFGIADWQSAARSVRRAGCSPDHALDLVAQATARRADWTSPAGVLYARCQNAHPSTPPSTGWPSPAPAVLAKRTANAQAARAAATLATIRADEVTAAAKAQQAAEALADLEARQGPAFDALAPDQAAEVIRSALAGTILFRLWSRARDEPLDRLTRQKVLQYLDRQPVPAN